jgi:hypothetical protein
LAKHIASVRRHCEKKVLGDISFTDDELAFPGVKQFIAQQKEIAAAVGVCQSQHAPVWSATNGELQALSKNY